jgi:hypothetical protein
MVVSGADKVLAKHLEAAVKHHEKREQIPPLSHLFSMLYRCDDDHFQDSLAIVGGVLFPSLLATSYIHASDRNVRQPHFELIQRLGDIDLNLRDLPWSDQLFEYFQDVIEIEEPQIELYPLSVVFLWLVDGMLSRKDNNKCFVMHHPALFDSIIRKFATNFRPNNPINHKVSQFSKLLALATSNRLLMMENSSYLRLLFLLLHDEIMATRITVFETLRLLCLDRSGRTKLFNFLDHKLVDMSLKALRQEALASTALEFLGVLFPHFSAKILLFSCPSLLDELADIAIMNKSYSLRAAQTIGHLAESMSLCAEGGSLLDCIMILCEATDHRVRYEGTRALVSQCRSRPACGFFVVHVPEAVSKLAAMAVDLDPKVRVSTVELISSLAIAPLNINVLAKNGRLLEALVANATASVELLGEQTRTRAILALLHLVGHEKTTQVVSEQLCMLKSWSTLCTANSTTFRICDLPTFL